jgi:hypothetical protein
MLAWIEANFCSEFISHATHSLLPDLAGERRAEFHRVLSANVRELNLS